MVSIRFNIFTGKLPVGHIYENAFPPRLSIFTCDGAYFDKDNGDKMIGKFIK